MPERWQEAKYPPLFKPETLDEWRRESPWVLVYDRKWKSYIVAMFVSYPDDEHNPCWIMFGPDAYTCEPTHWMYLPDPPEEA